MYYKPKKEEVVNYGESPLIEIAKRYIGKEYEKQMDDLSMCRCILVPIGILAECIPVRNNILKKR